MKKIYKKGFCYIACLCLSMISCFAITEKNYWWGTEYYVEGHEITEFRLRMQDRFNVLGATYTAGAIAAGAVGGVAGGIVGGAVDAAQQFSMSLFLTDLERRECVRKAIIVSLPNVIQGWNISEA